MSLRRQFIQKLLGLGASLPLVSSELLAKSITRRYSNDYQTNSVPIVLCSRGANWGEKVLTPAWNILNQTDHILDAIEAGANVVELDPEDTSVGYGGLPNENGVVSLDASIMYGPTHNCGSVAALENIKKACSVARLVMERTDHMMLVGTGAQQFARAHGFKLEDLLTEKARITWLRWKENLSDQDDWLPPKDGNYNPKRKGERLTY